MTQSTVPYSEKQAGTEGRKPADTAELKRRILDRNVEVGIIGLGYVGLPLAGTFNAHGYKVVGFDVDEAKVDQLTAGKSYIRHIPSEAVRRRIDDGLFRATTNFSEISKVDAIIICVPTPLTKDREPDISYVRGTAEAVAPYLRPGHLLVLESTTYPGTTIGLVRPILEKGSLRSGVDFFLAYSPEREDPGNPDYQTSAIPKVVGGDGPAALELALALYGEVVAGVVPVSSTETAEAVKLTENIFRAVNIALVNELKIVYEKMGIDIWEVIEAAKTKPFGYMPFYPGPGLGGHCIPIDPFYLTWKAKEYGIETRFIELAGEINSAMPTLVVRRLGEALNERVGKDLNGARVLVVGAAYKKNVDDIRESPALLILSLLHARGAQVDYYDPYIPEIKTTREHAELSGMRSIDWAPEALTAYDAALICTDHDDIDYGELVAQSKLVVDTRNATKGVGQGRERIVKA